MGRDYAALFPHLSTGKVPLANPITADKMPRMTNTLYDRIKQKIEELGLSEREASLRVSGTPDLIRNIKRGKSESLRGPRLLKLAEILGVSASWLQTGGDPISLTDLSPKRFIPVVGYVGAGAEIFSIDDHEKGGGIDEVEVPIPGMSLSSVAVRVRGDSMQPVYRPGDLIFYDSTDNGDLLHLIGKDCIVRLTDGRTFLKELHVTDGNFWLHSYNATPMMGVNIDWAAKVKVIQRA